MQKWLLLKLKHFLQAEQHRQRPSDDDDNADADDDDYDDEDDDDDDDDEDDEEYEWSVLEKCEFWAADSLAFQTVERLAAEDLTKELTNNSSCWPFVILEENL